MSKYVTYKVWVSIERCDEEDDDYGNEGEPVELAECSTLAEAEDLVEIISDKFASPSGWMEG